VVATEVDVSATIERIKQRRAEHARDGWAAREHTVPPCSEARAPQRLSGTLCGDLPGAEVVAVELGDLEDDSNARQAVSAIYQTTGCALLSRHRTAGDQLTGGTGSGIARIADGGFPETPQSSSARVWRGISGLEPLIVQRAQGFHVNQEEIVR